MTEKTQARPELRRCPVCGVMMVASSRDEQRPDPYHYECLNCGTVITLNTGNEREPGRRE